MPADRVVRGSKGERGERGDLGLGELGRTGDGRWRPLNRHIPLRKREQAPALCSFPSLVQPIVDVLIKRKTS